ncbi:class F sortase [Rossellomorea aquimaris]|uniref:LPXTG-site transpeptidase (Sortase) family protein n=1 Tax=Rossellomorea aquimaris TaxID=189382 RepID=A0A366EUP2_9BACI|nr:class F sortase [Rossellomorea aquimaris]RBP06098.1 LPXTG-site transpeptidase (sortase) family protein [Rossellomorea aquimaris]
MYTMRVVLLVLVLLPISACSAGLSSSSQQEKAETQTIEKQEEKPKAQMASTTTSPSPFADTIIKDERSGIMPTTIEIPAIDLSAPVEAVGLKENGEMAVTESFEKTGWYEGGYKPGEPGNAVIGGHVDSRNGPAIFYNLNKLSKGDEIIVKNKDGEDRTFVVTDMKEYPWDDAPLQSIFGYSHASTLNLITCTGDFDRSSRNYSKRLVVYTELKQ